MKNKYPFSHAANMNVDSITLDREKIKSFIIPVVEEVPVAEPAKKCQPAKKKEEKVTLKQILCKMVPYASFPYADHALRQLLIDPNKKAEADDE